jgi:hypothetical protein
VRIALEKDEEAVTVITVPPIAGPDIGIVESAAGSDTKAYLTEDALISTGDDRFGNNSPIDTSTTPAPSSSVIYVES